jgi:hypothetical protein
VLTGAADWMDRQRALWGRLFDIIDGICTECGMGRVAAGDVPTLLDLHREILDTHHNLA